MYNYDFHRPATLAAALSLVAANPEARPLAGGQTLIPTLKQRLASPSALVDLGGIAELRGIKVEGNKIMIGATTRHAEVAASADVKRLIPALAALAGGIGDPQVRNMGTIGGSLANSDPAADYPAAVLGLNATVRTNKRGIPADGFFRGMFETALEASELITAVEFTVPKRAGYAKFPNPASRYAVVGVMVAETESGIRVAVTGAGSHAFRSSGLEAALAKHFAPAAVDAVTVATNGLNSDLHASAEYRAHLIKVMAKRAVAAAG